MADVNWWEVGGSVLSAIGQQQSGSSSSTSSTSSTSGFDFNKALPYILIGGAALVAVVLLMKR